MTVIVVPINRWAEELRATTRRDAKALLDSARMTTFVDAPRWIQWSIRGGGLGGEAGGARTETERVSREKANRTNKGRNARSSYRAPIDTGDYANSWTPVQLGTGAMIYSAANPRVKAGVIELGRRPGKGIPLEPLSAWVRRKLGEKDPKRARSIAFAISLKHKKYGRKGLHVLGRAHPEIVKASKANAVRLMKAAHAKAAGLY